MIGSVSVSCGELTRPSFFLPGLSYYPIILFLCAVYLTLSNLDKLHTLLSPVLKESEINNFAQYLGIPVYRLPHLLIQSELNMVLILWLRRGVASWVTLIAVFDHMGYSEFAEKLSTGMCTSYSPVIRCEKIVSKPADLLLTKYCTVLLGCGISNYRIH